MTLLMKLLSTFQILLKDVCPFFICFTYLCIVSITQEKTRHDEIGGVNV